VTVTVVGISLIVAYTFFFICNCAVVMASLTIKQCWA